VRVPSVADVERRAKDAKQTFLVTRPARRWILDRCYASSGATLLHVRAVCSHQRGCSRHTVPPFVETFVFDETAMGHSGFCKRNERRVRPKYAEAQSAMTTGKDEELKGYGPGYGRFPLWLDSADARRAAEVQVGRSFVPRMGAPTRCAAREREVPKARWWERKRAGRPDGMGQAADLPRVG
jgi:hypothetical protein